MKYLITVKVDTNDADYNSKTTSISEEELLRLKPLIQKIKDFKPYISKGRTFGHNFPYGECVRDDLGEKFIEDIYGFTEDDIDVLWDVLPSCEYGFHTVEEIFVVPRDNIERLL